MKKRPRASRYDVTGNVEAEYADALDALERACKLLRTQEDCQTP